MKVHRSIAAWRAASDLSTRAGRGLVPTMGALHEGHKALVDRAVAENRQTVVTIYVNPTQFDNPDDLATYPDTLDDDIALLDAAGASDLVLPQYHELYPHDYTVFIDESEDSRVLCGASRDGHFRGVLSVVMKLLNVSQAERAYFGLKDYQQYHLVKKMVEAFFVPVEIVGVETVRDAKGLALSSRNRRLDDAQLATARRMNQLLRSDSLSLDEIRHELDTLGFRLDYLEERWGRRFIAAFLGDVRLIDNVPLPVNDKVPLPG
ncbi:MAG: pantoate--beta-alanine ligase [Gammaproteobacteria bacterium]|nr:MAG: pantoate--beta-alanine ligase [Gammaproteobacteria bacterium]